METAQEETLVKTKAREIFEPPTIADPWELMAQFYESKRYKDTYEGFYKSKKINPDVSEKEKEKVFLENESARYAFTKFGTEDVLFKFDGSKYPPRSLEAIDDYIKTVRDEEEMDRGRLSKDELESLDGWRYIYHTKAAEALVKDGIVPSTAVGEGFARLILVDKGLDTPESARRDSTSKKLRRKLSVSF